jgi:hypothetical protein
MMTLCERKVFLMYSQAVNLLTEMHSHRPSYASYPLIANLIIMNNLSKKAILKRS